MGKNKQDYKKVKNVLEKRRQSNFLALKLVSQRQFDGRETNPFENSFDQDHKDNFTSDN